MLSQTCSNSIEDSKWIITWEKIKIEFADLFMEANSVAGLSPSRQFRVGRNNVIKKKRPGCRHSFKMAAPKLVSFEKNLLRIAITSEAETPESGKAECFLAIGEEKK